jgi:hypothetical protein
LVIRAPLWSDDCKNQPITERSPKRTPQIPNTTRLAFSCWQTLFVSCRKSKVSKVSDFRVELLYCLVLALALDIASNPDISYACDYENETSYLIDKYDIKDSFSTGLGDLIMCTNNHRTSIGNRRQRMNTKPAQDMAEIIGGMVAYR